MRKKILAILLTISMSLFLGACESKEDKIQEEGDQQEALMEKEAEEEEESKPEIKEESGKRVAVLFSDEEKNRREESDLLRDKLGESGHEVKMYYAHEESDRQKEQLQKVLDEDLQVIVVEPVAVQGMKEELQRAAELGISVISYDKLLIDTEDVYAYVSFDYYKQGMKTGQRIIEEKNLANAGADEPLFMEVFTGGIYDVTGRIFYMGLTKELSDYLDKGMIISKSGRNTFESASIEGRNREKAEEKCREILETYYSEEPVDIICTTFDDMTEGVCMALEKDFYELTGEDAEEVPEKPWPLVTGGRYLPVTAGRIREERQSFSFETDRKELADVCAKVVESCLKDEKLEDASQMYDNGAKIVPAYLTKMDVID